MHHCILKNTTGKREPCCSTVKGNVKLFCPSNVAWEPDESASSCFRCSRHRPRSRSDRSPSDPVHVGQITTVYLIWGRFDTMTEECQRSRFEKTNVTHFTTLTVCSSIWLRPVCRSVEAHGTQITLGGADQRLH